MSYGAGTGAPLDVVDVTPVPLLPINAETTRPVTVTGEPWEAALDRHLGALPGDAPILIMIHGYKYSPRRPDNCPHRHVLAAWSGRGGRSTSWPRHLGFGKGAEEGLAIGFGWHARGSIWQAYRQAELAGIALADVVRRIATHHGRPVHIFCHSLGARVAFYALRDVPEGSVGRIVMLAGAEFSDVAKAAMASPAGRYAEVLNVVSGENALFDAMFEWLLQAPWARARALGRGLREPQARWVDLRIDDPATSAHLARLGFRIRLRWRPVCHWSGYLRPGMFALYRAVLTHPVPIPLHRLRMTPRPARERGSARPGFGLAG